MKTVCNLLALTIVFSAILASAQWIEKPTTGSPQTQLEDRTKMSGMTGLHPELRAGFVDEEKNAREKQAVVRLDVWGVNLVEPGSMTEASNTKAFVSYVLDHNEPIMSKEEEYTFQNLSPGQHTVTVQLMASNNQPIGAKMILGVHIPK